MNGLAHDKLKSNVDYNLEILVVVGLALSLLLVSFRKHPFKAVQKLLLNVFTTASINHVLDHLILGVKNDISQLSEVFTDYLCIVHVIEENLLRKSNKDL